MRGRGEQGESVGTFLSGPRSVAFDFGSLRVCPQCRLRILP